MQLRSAKYHIETEEIINWIDSYPIATMLLALDLKNEAKKYPQNRLNAPT